MTDEQKVPRWADRSDRAWPIEVVPASAYDKQTKEIERLRSEHAGHERVLTAVTQWLESNQPDVFSRGLWDVVFAARRGTS
jgi:hypothetical protein